MRRPAVLLLLTLALLGGCAGGPANGGAANGGPAGGGAAAAEEASSPRETTPAPELAGPGLAGGRHDLADLRGSVVIVNVWASWCAPCRKEVPVLERASEELGPEGLEVLGLNARDLPDAASTFVEDLGVSYPSIVDPEGTKAVEWGVVGMPETFLVDREGNIVDRHFGEVTQEWVQEVVVPEVRR
ncbi:hypothetical protein GCM10023169_35620 [Georgenia halophila]|uniref:Thioredoxin domain-containing protein n=1 Tax=Georgenia halophila TaxID=620889 RepID=A0ABP8LN19_9MICO